MGKTLERGRRHPNRPGADVGLLAQPRMVGPEGISNSLTISVDTDPDCRYLQHVARNPSTRAPRMLDRTSILNPLSASGGTPGLRVGSSSRTCSSAAGRTRGASSGNAAGTISMVERPRSIQGPYAALRTNPYQSSLPVANRDDSAKRTGVASQDSGQAPTDRKIRNRRTAR